MTLHDGQMVNLGTRRGIAHHDPAGFPDDPHKWLIHFVDGERGIQWAAESELTALTEQFIGMPHGDPAPGTTSRSDRGSTTRTMTAPRGRAPDPMTGSRAAGPASR
ncbi:hypothetical protein [Streptomyces sp. NPDC058595]|uniref:hypothetical protein n=1 Tax=Streptomyces sp. NPDC058595 TaxID=3346550 RepID=UPI0036586006